ncbi:hypothetical protein R3P38DRAFT_3234338 [Favolaschia claudopus]|uniref:Uncharacterized protein n=1 Tax=Favolaschia claudopus TaxID=2862362 RepID=A0AAV9ZGB2_9AGAR
MAFRARRCCARLPNVPSPAHTRWNAHFGFFATLQDAEKNFPAIRATDIALRKRYVPTPFAYSRDLDDRELYNEIVEWRIKEAVPARSADSRQTQLPNGGGRGAAPARRARGGGGRGSIAYRSAFQASRADLHSSTSFWIVTASTIIASPFLSCTRQASEFFRATFTSASLPRVVMAISFPPVSSPV